MTIKQNEIIENKDAIIEINKAIIANLERQVEIHKKLYNETSRKKAHWRVVRHGFEDNMYLFECSNCKDTVWVSKDEILKWNYCPNCGLEMTQPMESKK